MSGNGTTPGDGAAGSDRLAEAGREIKDIGARAGDAAGRAASDVSRHAQEAAMAAKAEGESLAGTVRDSAAHAAEAGKDAGAAQGLGIARAIRHAADDLQDSSPAIAEHVRSAAASVEGVAEALRSQSVGDLLGKASRFAQRQPAAFFGVAMLAGFAAARFAISSTPDGDRPEQRRSWEEPL